MPFPGLRGRILVAVPGLAAFLAVILWGGPTASLALFALLAGLAAYEAVTLCVVSTPIPLRFMVGSAAALSTLLTGVGSQYAMQALMLPGAVHAMWWISRRTPEGARAGMLGVMALTAYYTLGFGVLARLSLGWTDRAPVLIPLVSCWVGDSFAYFAGCRWGRHKMLPLVSPAKSWEGFTAGIAGSMASVAVLGRGTAPLAHLLLVGLLCGVAGVIGDFFESAVKRDAGIKDSGRFLADHGGILDRFDSVVAAAPVALVLYGLLGMG